MTTAPKSMVLPRETPYSNERPTLEKDYLTSNNE
jgi:hypothetical protein